MSMNSLPHFGGSVESRLARQMQDDLAQVQKKAGEINAQGYELA